MRRISSEDQEAVALAVDALKRGGVAILPSDTLHGFSTALGNRAGHDRIRAIKGGAPGRRFIYLASGIDMVARYVGGWGCTSRKKLAAIWPAPLTAILPSGANCPGWIGDTIALRVPRCRFLHATLEALGEPVASTSVNRAGAPPLEDPDTIERCFGDRVELIVSGEKAAGGPPSTLVDFSRGTPVVIRSGGYAWAATGKPSK